ncbi:MAG: ribosome small subunit-dependent GTPase A [Oscillospiraceae bacterium]|nr:ribosome small subunit-dependent GTPase A [Oscillospiraceae bacterium]
MLKGIGGFYYVKTADAVLECRAKGIFRRRGLTPLAGDSVTVEGEEGGYVISEIALRSNALARPAVANVGALFIVQSSCDPRPNYRVIDEMSAIALRAGIKPIVVLTKTDIEPDDEFLRIYRRAGFEAIDLHGQRGALERLRELAAGKISVFSGNSGVGKSTLINLIDPRLELETGLTSKKLGRGRHTTRAVCLYEFAGGWLADTPGFSSLDFTEGDSIPSRELAGCFPEFEPFTESCAFSDCSHTVEKGCAVLAALERGEIEPSRHESYKELCRRAREAENRW